ncbi:GGDEF domain-containing protein [Alkalimarinus sediminis]|uniref:diguanylate cyclase n=1 Tax=Alkalimarinus sediminis TaxID=1632866 RepID=A0A9E8HKD1_9ALTE|nr:GGDEF domain-containing protein [Alkalimarinus sediminis]UZW74386.1 GGDEF domain-containing protein [Alkalimarinus sediminis]
MAHTAQTPPQCPAQQDACEIITELVDLRDQVSELSELVHTDTLTGLSNFRYFMQALEQEMERTRRTGHATGLIMLDLDFFKKVNDDWGHDVGNKALILASRIIKASVRKMDAPCRYGGEEFAVILPSTDRRHTLMVAERMREAIASTPLTFDENELILTASFGVDIYTGTETGCAEEMVKRADSYLYQAKHEGRNRVCIAPLEEKEDRSSVNQDEKDALFGLFGRSSDLSDESY